MRVRQGCLNFSLRPFRMALGKSVEALFRLNDSILDLTVFFCKDDSTAGFFGYHLVFSFAVLQEAINITRKDAHLEESV